MVLEVSICGKEDGERKQLSLTSNAAYQSLKLLWTKMAEEPVRKNLGVSYQPGGPKPSRELEEARVGGPYRSRACTQGPCLRRPSGPWVCRGCQERREGTGNKPWECLRRTTLTLTAGKPLSQRPHCAQLSQRVPLRRASVTLPDNPRMQMSLYQSSFMPWLCSDTTVSG